MRLLSPGGVLRVSMWVLRVCVCRVCAGALHVCGSRSRFAAPLDPARPRLPVSSPYPSAWCRWPGSLVTLLWRTLALNRGHFRKLWLVFFLACLSSWWTLLHFPGGVPGILGAAKWQFCSIRTPPET